MLKKEISMLANGENLSREATEIAFDKIMSGQLNEAKKSAIHTSLFI